MTKVIQALVANLVQLQWPMEKTNALGAGGARLKKNAGSM
jgi:hypothetical protein